MKRFIAVITVLLCGLAVVCAALLKTGRLSSIFSCKTGAVSVIGKADGPTAVFAAKKISPVVVTSFIKRLCIAACAAGAAFLFSFTQKIRFEKALSSLTKK